MKVIASIRQSMNWIDQLTWGCWRHEYPGQSLIDTVAGSSTITSLITAKFSGLSLHFTMQDERVSDNTDGLSWSGECLLSTGLIASTVLCWQDRYHRMMMSEKRSF